jgi:hypothetical protein
MVRVCPRKVLRKSFVGNFVETPSIPVTATKFATKFPPQG